MKPREAPVLSRKGRPKLETNSNDPNSNDPNKLNSNPEKLLKKISRN
jgi:hypothetical protein